MCCARTLPVTIHTRHVPLAWKLTCLQHRHVVHIINTIELFLFLIPISLSSFRVPIYCFIFMSILPFLTFMIHTLPVTSALHFQVLFTIMLSMCHLIFYPLCRIPLFMPSRPTSSTLYQYPPHLHLYLFTHVWGHSFITDMETC
ncbi:hypothetical protein BDQ12DRAFT_375416 [Crucibulum laeve]|uniref:Uncharacterized protein n=1 Tax=Crucibulum laeve TaxID=68775 RepID=A0A5C3LQ97_9AGAR|nr:hypothetical protein BDQ12DRAFT_375416 [Crucibulum laeve]